MMKRYHHQGKQRTDMWIPPYLDLLADKSIPFGVDSTNREWHMRTRILWRIIETYEAIRVAGDQASRRPTGYIRRSGTRAGGRGSNKHSHLTRRWGRECSAADSRADLRDVIG